MLSNASELLIGLHNCRGAGFILNTDIGEMAVLLSMSLYLWVLC